MYKYSMISYSMSKHPPVNIDQRQWPSYVNFIPLGSDIYIRTKLPTKNTVFQMELKWQEKKNHKSGIPYFKTPSAFGSGIQAMA